MVRTQEGSTSATWERDLKSIFIDICLREVEKGNRPTTHFNKDGWANIGSEFTEQTGKAYTKLQMKNKWDAMKKDWKLWKELKRGSTGLGWDPIARTIDASDDWWEEKLQVIPTARKFRYAGIDPDMEEKLDRLFGGVVATGQHAWAPNMADAASEDRGEEMTGMYGTFGTHFMEEPSMGGRAPVHSGSKRKHSSRAAYDDALTRMVDVCEARSRRSMRSVNEPCDVTRATLLLDTTPDVFDDMPLYLWSTKFLQDPIPRAQFLAMVPERRGPYLRFHYEENKK